jgi:hypothetical protein
MQLDPDIQARIEAVLRCPVRAGRAITDRGYTPQGRWVLTLADGRTAFAKVAPAREGEYTRWLRTEREMYEVLPATVAPRLLAWDDDGRRPILLLEDLSDCDWPPPWTPGRVRAVLDTMAEAASLRPPAFTTPVDASTYVAGGWEAVVRHTKPFLSTGIVSTRWLAGALSRLVDAARPELLLGDALLHCDVRSDNLCLRDGRALLIDWNHAAVGNALFDVAFWLPSLEMEGGPPPEEVIDVPPGMTAIVAGFFAARAGRAVIPAAPRVREIQMAQLRFALPWAARALGLPPPDGPLTVAADA